MGRTRGCFGPNKSNPRENKLILDNPILCFYEAKDWVFLDKFQKQLKKLKHMPTENEPVSSGFFEKNPSVHKK